MKGRGDKIFEQGPGHILGIKKIKNFQLCNFPCICNDFDFLVDFTLKVIGGSSCSC